MKGSPSESGQQNSQSIQVSPNLAAEASERRSPLPQPPMPDGEVCDRLLKAVEQAALDSSHSMEALRLAVADFTIALRQRGTTPEAVLISLKAVINGRLVMPRRDLFVNRRNPEIHEKISTWSIQEFFRGTKEP